MLKCFQNRERRVHIWHPFRKHIYPEIKHTKLIRGSVKLVFSLTYESGHRRRSAILVSDQYDHISEVKDKEDR